MPVLSPIRNWPRVAGALLAMLILVATPIGAGANTANDPLQSFNRAMFGFNDVIDRALIRPLAVGYRAVLPGSRPPVGGSGLGQ